jgi:hypothetical protein
MGSIVNEVANNVMCDSPGSCYPLLSPSLSSPCSSLADFATTLSASAEGARSLTRTGRINLPAAFVSDITVVPARETTATYACAASFGSGAAWPPHRLPRSQYRKRQGLGS